MEQQGKKGLAIASLVLGIAACVISWWGLVLGIIGIVCAIVGLILAINAQKSYKALGQKNGIATAGLILSIIGLVLSIIGVVVSVIGFFTCTVCACAASKALQDPSVQSSLANALSSALAQ